MAYKKVAIIGMACRFPGSVTNLDELWRLLRDERDAITEVPAERFGTDYFRHPSPREPGKSYTFAAGVLDSISEFDPGFFSISPREAEQMDPQQRLLLELAWEAFEDASVCPSDMRGRRGGVYIGAEVPDYTVRQADDPCSIDPYSATGATFSILSNRISYLFDLRGPSMTINTACSSSMVALQQAIQDLQIGNTDFALAGGVNILMHPGGFVCFSKASMLSPRGRCRAFDATGDGYVRAEGAAVMVLKLLDHALADGDTIHAVIAGSGANSDGYTQGGISVPGAPTQAALMRDVYARAGIDPRAFSYFEAHGTGTAVGDPIETRAIGEVLAAGRDESDPLLIGSVKTNIGHLECASGVAGLFKAVLCIKHRAAPRTLHFETPNPNIDFKGLRLKVVDRYTPLAARNGNGIMVGVNSFGFGGTNAHVVLMEPPASNARADHAAPASSRHADSLPPLVLTARATQALAALAGRYLELLDAGHDWSALAAQTVRRRQWLEQRAIVAPANLAEGRDALAALAQGEATPDCVVQGQAIESQARVALLFSGNGSQWPGMGRQLYEENAVFRAALDEADALWRADGSASLVEVMRAGATPEWLAATENAQPLLFVIQVGVTRVLQAYGIRFEATLGHSVGEIAAAWADGSLTLTEAIHVIKARSRAQALTRGTGRMAAAGISETDASQLIERLGLTGQIEVAGMNSPQSVTLVGALSGLEQIGAELSAKEQFFQILELDYPFHSAHMDPIKQAVLDQLADLKPHNGKGGYVSTVTGQPLAGTALDAGYWWRNIREPVRFGAAVAHLAAQGVRLFIEVGPHAILRTYVKQTLAAADLPGAALATLKRDHDAAAELRHELLSAIAQGAAVDLDTLVPQPAAQANGAGGPAHIPLPTYPWQRERYWVKSSPEDHLLANRKRIHPLLGYRLHGAAWAWENEIDPVRMPIFADHVFDGGAVFPGTGYVEMALTAAREIFGMSDPAIENLEILTPIVFTANRTKVVRLTAQADTGRLVIESRDRMSDPFTWTKNVTGRILKNGSLGRASDAPGFGKLDIDALMSAHQKIELALDYNRVTGMNFGPLFRWVSKFWLLGDLEHSKFDMVLTELTMPAAIGGPAGLAGYNLHPALVDSGLHPLFTLMHRLEDIEKSNTPTYIPVQLGRIDYLGNGDTICRALMQIERRSAHSAVATISFLDADNTVVLKLSTCRFRRVDLNTQNATPPSHLAHILEARPLPGQFRANALPAPADLIAQAVARLDGLGAEEQAQRALHLTSAMPLLDVLASLYALAAFDALGMFGQPISSESPGIPHAALAKRLADMLVEDGLAHRDGERLVRDDAAYAGLPRLGTSGATCWPRRLITWPNSRCWPTAAQPCRAYWPARYRPIRFCPPPAPAWSSISSRLRRPGTMRTA
jgi:acyl transferase domain-containing protein